MGLKFFLFPFQWMFIFISSLRKFFYFKGIIKRKSFDVPVICVGNISTGGTGKTPHTKYITKLLAEHNFKTAIILRGYKRKTKGIIECSKKHTVDDIGDEAMEYLNSIPENVSVFVARKRKKGIKFILEQYPDMQVIVMDDGYQHFRVKAGMYVLLTDYHKLYVRDRVLPLGSLREPASAAKRADIIVVSKSPKVYSPLIEKNIRSQLKPTQEMFMSYISYDELKSLSDEKNDCLDNKDDFYSIFMISAIANSYPLEEHLKRYCIELRKFDYPDHYAYIEKDVKKLRNEFNTHLVKNKIIVTTQKDVPRLMKPEIKELLVDLPFYYVPISIGFHEKDISFDQKILDYVRENTRNDRFYKG